MRHLRSILASLAVPLLAVVIPVALCLAAGWVQSWPERQIAAAGPSPDLPERVRPYLRPTWPDDAPALDQHTLEPIGTWGDVRAGRVRPR